MSKIPATTRTKEGDFYETPTWALEALLKRESFEGEVLDPCSGKGAICKVLEKYGYKVKGSDIQTSDEIYGDKGVDAYSIEKMCDNIITNPPYSTKIGELVNHFMGIYQRKMALLLRLTFLEGKGRHDMFTTHPLKIVYVFSSRVTMYPADEEMPDNDGTIAYAWFVWEKGYIGRPTINWISAEDTYRKQSKKKNKSKK